MLLKLSLYCLLTLTPIATWAQNNCPTLPVHQQAQIANIQDGDTLYLTDGRRIRLIAINTPELGQDSRPAQAFAKDAKQAAIDFFSDTETIHLHISSREKDRYGRILAHVFHPQKGSLEEYLVSLGLAFPITVPPDFLLSSCLNKTADEAREKKLGIWKSAEWTPKLATNLKSFNGGFSRICGSVSKVDRAGPLWIELKGEVVIRIDQNDWPNFKNSNFNVESAEGWIGKKIELWGWLQDRRAQKDLMKRGFKPWVAPVRSPTELRWTSTCE